SALNTTPTVCANTDLSNCVFLPSEAGPPNQTFAWNHGGVQPEIAATWAGFVGPGVRQGKHLDDNFYSDHTDLRPTMLELLGLKDTYVSDGRVLTELIHPGALPNSLRSGGDEVEQLGQAYKQIMASFGAFSLNTLTASSGALASNSFGDKTYTDTENALAQLGADRDALAGQIRMALWNAEFNNQKIDHRQARDWEDQADDLLARAAALAAKFQSVDDKDDAKQLNKI